MVAEGHSLFTRIARPLLAALLAIWYVDAALAHPLGSMLVVDEAVVFSYVCPAGDSDHHACVMVWTEAGGAVVWIHSAHPASDFLFSLTDQPGEVAFLERRYDATRDVALHRLLRGRIGGDVIPASPWRDSPPRFADGGIAVTGGEILVGAYPQVVRIDGQEIHPVDWPHLGEVASIRRGTDGSLLVLTDGHALRVNEGGTPLADWGAVALAEPDPDLQPPIAPDAVFSIDADESVLAAAYWGQRRFVTIDLDSGDRETILQLETPWMPHAITISGNVFYALASTMEPGHVILPRLWRIRDGVADLVWEPGTSGTEDD